MDRATDEDHTLVETRHKEGPRDKCDRRQGKEKAIVALSLVVFIFLGRL